MGVLLRITSDVPGSREGETEGRADDDRGADERKRYSAPIASKLYVHESHSL